MRLNNIFIKSKSNHKFLILNKKNYINFLINFFLRFYNGSLKTSYLILETTKI